MFPDELVRLGIISIAMRSINDTRSYFLVAYRTVPPTRLDLNRFPAIKRFVPKYQRSHHTLETEEAAQNN